MASDKELEERIEGHVSTWKVPFDDDSVVSAKRVLMRRISESTEEVSENVIELRKPNSYFWLKVAAVLALVFAGGVALFLAGNNTLKNESNSISTVNLPDGSSILFTPGSTVSYNSTFWNWDRTIRFSGEGYFDVNPGTTFTVITPVGLVEVLGTAFSLWADQKDMFAHCTEGRVRVWNAKGGDVELGSGEFLDIEDGVMAAVMLYNSDGFISPRYEQFLSFESVPVAIVLNELEIALNVKIKNALPSNLVYTGILDISDENQCFQVFCKPFGAIFEKQADGHVSIHL